MTHSAPSLSEVLRLRRLPALDGLRAVSVGLVIAYHAGIRVPGDLGVSAFFVLSGFLITLLLLREHAEVGTIDLRAFYLRRTLRIFPAYYTFIAFSFALDAVLGDRWPGALLFAASTYTVNYYNAALGHPGTSIAHAWSLAVEEQFYLLWPVVFLGVIGRGRRAVAWGLVAAIVAGAVWRAVSYGWLGLPAHYAYNAFETRLDNLAVGCLAAVATREAWFDRFARALAAHPGLPLVTVALILWSSMSDSHDWHYTGGLTADVLLVAVLVLQLLQLAGHRLWAWLEHPAMRYLGLLSYSLYLYHQWGLALGRKLTVLPPAAQTVAGVLATVALAAGSYYVVERPFLALKRRYARSAEPAGA